MKVGNGGTCHPVGEGELIFCEEKTGIAIKMTMLIVPGFAKNILSIKRLLVMGYGVEAKGKQMIIRNHEGKTLFTCDQEANGMFYLSGRHLKTAGIFNMEETEWLDPLLESVDAEGRTKATQEKQVLPKRWKSTRPTMIRDTRQRC